MKIDLNFFPGWVRKSLTFTIDDGNVRLDRKFMDYVKPAGIRGTFNLSTPLTRGTPDFYREFYRGYEISNHCYHHSQAFRDGVEYKYKDEIFPGPDAADKEYVYRSGEDGIWRNWSYNWTYISETDAYIRCMETAQDELESVFGKGNVRGYVWPCGDQHNAELFEKMKKLGFYGLRKTGNVKGSTNFALPDDWDRWSYNANDACVAEVSAEYDALPDDGELKFFALGVHSHDFENHDCWNRLADFCDLLGNRPETYWYATVGEIYDYAQAVKSVKLTEDENGVTLENPSDVTLYVKVNDKRYTLCSEEQLRVER